MSHLRSSPPIRIAAVIFFALTVMALVWFSASGPSPFLPTETAAEAAAIRRDLTRLKRAAIQFARNSGRLPASLTDLVPAQLPQLPRDPYGRDYVLHSGGPGQIYIWSLGADGQRKRYPPDIAAIVTLDEALAAGEGGNVAPAPARPPDSLRRLRCAEGQCRRRIEEHHL